MKKTPIWPLFLALLIPLFGTSQFQLQDKVVSENRDLVVQYQGYFASHDIDISGDWLVAGAALEDHHGTNAGAAYLYHWENCEWVFKDEILHPNPATNDNFGISVAISGDMIVVGCLYDDQYATQGGNAFVYKNAGGTASYQQMLEPQYGASLPDAEYQGYFGNRVAIYGDVIVVAADGESQDASGGNAYGGAGAAYVYRRPNAVSPYAFEQKLVGLHRAAADNFGHSLAIDGNNILVGAPGQDTDASGSSTASNAGAAFVFSYGLVWGSPDKLVASDRDADDAYGWSVDISGLRLAVGAYTDETGITGPTAANAGSVYCYAFASSVWGSEQKIVNSDWSTSDNFGYDVGMFNSRLIVGANFEDLDENGTNPITGAGAAYIFDLSGGIWSETQKLVAPVLDRSPFDYYGGTVAIDADRAAVGSGSDDDDEDWLTSGNTVSNAGSAYVYDKILPPDIPTISSSHTTVCECSLPIISLSITAGNLNDATHWQWYSGSCGGTPIGTGTSINVNPSSTTTYCVRGEGCFIPGACECFTVTVNDGPSLNLPNSVCEGDAPLLIHLPPLPPNVINLTFSGTAAGAVTGAYYLDPSLLSPGTYNLTACYHYADGSICCCYYKFKVKESPVVTLDDIQDVDLCTWNGQPIQLNGTSSGGNCTYGGPGVIPTTGLFYPNVAGVGTHILTYTCTLNGCSSNATISVDVTDDGSWHKTTVNTEGTDAKNDVVVDSYGSVYVTGSYIVETTFPDMLWPVTMQTGSGSMEVHSFVAKYSNCGELIWVVYTNHIDPTFWNYGKDLVINYEEDLLYVAGNFNSEIEFLGPYGSGAGAWSPQSTGTTGDQGYVLCLNTSDGEMHWVNPVNYGNETQLRAITYNANDNAIYVGGYHDGPSNPGEQRAFIQKYQPSGALLGSPSWTLQDISDGNSYINDLDFDETLQNGGLWMIGEFNVEVTLASGFGSGATIYNNNGGLGDAFISLYDDGGSLTESFIVNGMATDGYMSGSGIAADEGNHVAFATGTYYNGISNVFNFGHGISNNSTGNAYFVAIDDAGNSYWGQSRWADAYTHEVIGVDVTYVEEHAYFTGMYNNEMTFTGTSNMGLVYSAIPSTSGEMHVYAASYNSISSEPVWTNGTLDPSSNTAEHRCTAIAHGPFSHAFIVGSYKERLGYILGNPASGILSSTGSNPVNYNAFTMRVELLNSGSFKMDKNEPEIEPIISDNNEITLYPNPTTGMVNVDISGFDESAPYQLQVLSLEGRLIENMQLNTALSMIDLSAYDAGIYVIRISNGTETTTMRMIKSQ